MTPIGALESLRAFYAAQIADAKASGVLLSLHLKATMMKVSDPIMFGLAVRVFFKDLFAKHAATLATLGVDLNNGFGDLLGKIEKLPADLAVGRSEGLWRHKQAVAGDGDTIDPARVVEDGVEPLGSDVGTDPFYDLLWGERLTEDVDGLLPSGGADHVPLGDEFSAQRLESGPPLREREIDPGTGGGARHGWWWERGAVAGQSLNLTRPPAPPQVRG
jgi:hypothetical protein